MVFGSTLEGARWAFPSYSNLMKLASFLGKLQLIEIIFEGEFFSCTYFIKGGTGSLGPRNDISFQSNQVKGDEKQHGEVGGS